MAKIKIEGDASPIRKSLLELERQVKSVGSSKISLFDKQEQEFIKTEVNKQLTQMKTNLKNNQEELKKLIDTHKKLKEGTEMELKLRKKIVDSYQVQAKLAKQIGDMERTSNVVSGGGAGGGGMGGGILGKIPGVGGLIKGGLLGAALGGVMFTANKAMKASAAYAGSASDRVSMQGLTGQGDIQKFGPEAMASAGMNEEQMIRRRIQLSRQLGKDVATEDTIMQQARFERAFGLNAGAMGNVATSLRANFGAQGANDAQMKLQASILANGIEDAIGPYLEAATELLSSINENGLSATSELVSMFGSLVGGGSRTAEQIAKNFGTVNDAVEGSSGEQNAFFQQAFANAGIGGGTIGATRLALESGGIFGLDKEALQKRGGYSPELLEEMGGAGFFGGAQKRSGAILDQFRKSLGLESGTKLSDVKDLETHSAGARMANNLFGTKGQSGWDALTMLEKVEGGSMSGKAYDAKLKDLKAGDNPVADRLDKINATLAGHTDVLTNIRDSLEQDLGESVISVRNALVEADNIATKTLTTGSIGVLGDEEEGSGFMSKVGAWLKEGGNDEAMKERAKKPFKMSDIGSGFFKHFGSDDTKKKKAFFDEGDPQTKGSVEKLVGSIDELVNVTKKQKEQTTRVINEVKVHGANASVSSRTAK